MDVEHVSEEKYKAYILTKGPVRMKFQEIKEFIGVQDSAEINFKFNGMNVGISLKMILKKNLEDLRSKIKSILI